MLEWARRQTQNHQVTVDTAKMQLISKII